MIIVSRDGERVLDSVNQGQLNLMQKYKNTKLEMGVDRIQCKTGSLSLSAEVWIQLIQAS